MEEPGNCTTGDSFTGERDCYVLYLGSLKSIPPLTAAEETDLLARWHEFKDKRARDRVITGSLHLVPPIARKQAWKFNLNVFSTEPELVAEGNLHLVQAFDAFPMGSNVRFENYARVGIKNGIVRRAISLLSVIDRPWGVRTKQDIHIDPTMPDLVWLHEDIGCSQAKPTAPTHNGARRPTASAKLRDTTARRPKVLELDGLTLEERNIITARLGGCKLREIAAELEVSIATAWRREQRAIGKLRINHGTSDHRGTKWHTAQIGDARLPARADGQRCHPLPH